ncbi:MAG: 4-hydroxybenzoate octaprenyltransferase [Alphaproteobacteria bacterium]
MARRDAAAATDIGMGGPIERLLPAGLLPFARLARLDRPIGTWLLLFPCWWGAGLAWATQPGIGTAQLLWLCLLFAIGSLVMRGAGCTFNDIADRQIDAKVARTALRPLPSGAVTLRGAWTFLALQLAVGAAVLFALDGAAILVGLAALPLIAIYPFMKRVTWWPQAFLGITFNWGALVGWVAATGEIGAPALLLYAAGIAWTLGYDTIYAHQDREDDALIGVRSTALLFGTATRRWLVLFYGLTVALLAGAGVAAGAAWPFHLGVAGAAAHLAWQVGRVDIDRPADCLAKFRSNRWIGWILLGGIATAGLAAGAVHG